MISSGRDRSAVVSRVVRWCVGVVVLVLLAGVGFWAGRVTLGSPVAEPGEFGSVVHVVAEASVGRSLSLNVTVEQPFVPVAVNNLAGTVTAVGSGDDADVGDILYEVDTVPVRVVAGQVPFWRAMASGVQGEDVAQLQAALAELGLFGGVVDGRFGLSTGQAVREWQRRLGLPVTGVVQFGELVAVPALPARLRLSEQVVAGVRLSGGEQAVSAASGELRFFLVVSPGQAGLIPPDAVVTVEHEDQAWPAVLGESVFDEGGGVRFVLTAADGGLVCADACGMLPAVERSSLRARVTVVPQVSGPAVPAAAVLTDPDGRAWVRMADGARRDVTVLGSSGGVVVVEGLAVGERVQVLGGPAGVPGQVPAPAPTGSAGGGDRAGG
jgi:peptidoglycan hydrolase-like protein with peptidoglycan-binding domain